MKMLVEKESPKTEKTSENPKQITPDQKTTLNASQKQTSIAMEASAAQTKK